MLNVIIKWKRNIKFGCAVEFCLEVKRDDRFHVNNIESHEWEVSVKNKVSCAENELFQWKCWRPVVKTDSNKDAHQYVWVIFEFLLPMQWKKVFDCISVIVVCHDGWRTRNWFDEDVATHETRPEAVSASVAGHPSAEPDQYETETRNSRVTWLSAQKLGDHCNSSRQDPENCE